MPTYDYNCIKCDEKLEILQKITDEPLTTCPKCGAENSLKRGFGGGIGLNFTGSGYYITDYVNQPKQECCPCGKNKTSCSSVKE